MNATWKPRLELLEAREVPASLLGGFELPQVIYAPGDPTDLPPPPPPPGGGIVIVTPPTPPAPPWVPGA